MFLHYGMSTFTGQEWSDGKAPASTYHPDKLDVDQWIQVARDAGMKYAVLTAKHVAGHCLWPSRQTDYSVAQSGNTTDVVGAFVKSCERRGVLPGLYYCSFDNHHLFGSVTVDHAGLPYDTVEQVHIIERSGKAYTTSAYQDFETAQITELLTEYGPVAEMWIDEPGVLGHGYRTFLYHHIASLQPHCVIVANGSYGDPAKWDAWFTWPQDVIGYEQYEPPPPRHVAWRTVEGKRYYLPAEVYDVIASSWFYKENDKLKTDSELLKLYTETRERGANLLLDVPPDQHGMIPQGYRDALMRLRRNAAL
jgi:alpha-L-fucosidase